MGQLPPRLTKQPITPSVHPSLGSTLPAVSSLSYLGALAQPSELCVVLRPPLLSFMTDSPPASPDPNRALDSPPLHPSPSSAFALDPTASSLRLTQFPHLSPLPSPTAQSSCSLLLPTEAVLSWPPLPPQQPRRGHSLPEWITDMPSPLSTDPRQPQSLSPSMHAALFSSLPPPLSNEAVPAWTSVTAASYSTSISHSSSSSRPIRADVLFSANTSPSSAFQLLRATSSSSSASSSPDSSSPSSSSASSPSAVGTSFSTANPPRRRYQRLTGLSHEQRMERRRQSHRELDAVRRQREALAISRLSDLTATTHATRSLAQQQPHSRSQSNIADTGGVKQEDEQMEVDVMEADEKGKRHRTAVLENSVEKLEELQNLVHHLSATVTQQSQDIAALRLQLHSTGLRPLPATAVQSSQTVPLLSASNIRRVVAEFGASSLYSALFTSVSVGLLLVDCASGVVLDVNERLLVGGQCTREDVVGRFVAPTYQAITTVTDWDTQPAVEPTTRMHVRGQPAMMYSQYGVTKESVLALYRGQVDQIYVVWRAQLGDGLAYELPLSGFIASRDDAIGGRPRTVLVALSLSEAKRI